METLAPLWACDPRDLSDLREEPSSVWGEGMWTEQLPPHLQRNKQLHDTLLQREEELARLQEENNKLRQFFSSSFVRNLQLKAKKLSADGRRELKRNLMYPEDGLLTSQQVSKRVCRNLTAEFCSESSETSSEPNLDLWVLRTLGLKDRDTIDTSDTSSGYSLSTSLYDHTASSSSPSEYSLGSSFSSSSTPTSVHGCCRTLTPQTEFGYGTAGHQEADFGSPTKSPPRTASYPGQCCDFTAAGSPDAAIRNSNVTAFLSSPRQPAITQTPDRSQTTAPNPVQTGYWSPLSQDRTHFSPFSPVACSSPVMNQLKAPVSDANPASPLTLTTPQTPRSRTDLAFSMSLSPSSSVKTHSFPQGQAFVRKDSGGRWNFTWVPRQGP